MPRVKRKTFTHHSTSDTGSSSVSEEFQPSRPRSTRKSMRLTPARLASAHPQAQRTVQQEERVTSPYFSSETSQKQEEREGTSDLPPPSKPHPQSTLVIKGQDPVRGEDTQSKIPPLSIEYHDEDEEDEEDWEEVPVESSASTPRSGPDTEISSKESTPLTISLDNAPKQKYVTFFRALLRDAHLLLSLKDLRKLTIHSVCS